MGRSQRHMILQQGYNAAAAALDEGVVAPGLLLQVDDPDVQANPGQYSEAGVVVPIGAPGGPLDGSTLTGPVPNGAGGGPDPEPPEDPFGIVSILPAEFPAGYPDTGATVAGAGFEDGAVVVFGGADMDTDFISDNQLNFTLPSSTAAAGPVAVTVRNPGGEVTAEVTFNFIEEPAQRQGLTGPQGIVSVSRRNGKLVILVDDPSRILPGLIVTIEATGNTSVNGEYKVLSVDGNEVTIDNDFDLANPIEGKGRLLFQS